MIIFSPKTLEWTSDDALRLKEFLDSQTGIRVLQFLDLSAPEITDGAHAHKALVMSGRVAQHHETLNNLFKLTYENPNEPIVPTTASDNYKSLDDDAAWVEIDKAVDKSKTSAPIQ
jgi:hypothetical protein